MHAIWDFRACIAIYLTSQNFIKHGKIRMGKRKEKNFETLPLDTSSMDTS